MHLAPLGNAQQYCSVYNFQLVFRGLFFLLIPLCLYDADRFSASIGNVQYKGEKKNMDLIAAFRLFVRTLPIHFALLGRKRKYTKLKTTAKLKEKKNHNRRGARHIANV
jgi:hypothetical protein